MLKKFAEKRLEEMFESGCIDEDFFDVDLDKKILKKIHDYQTIHVINMITAVKKNGIAIDGSSTGTGKTYTTIAVCKYLGLSPFIICPKSVMSTWASVCKHFKVKPTTIVNYETIKNCKQHDKHFNKKDSIIIKRKIIGDKNVGYHWDFSSMEGKNCVVIFDEAHKCKHIDTDNGKLLLSLKYLLDRSEIKIMLLTATLCDKTEDFLPYGFMIGLYKSIHSGKSWIEQTIRETKNKNVNILNKFVYPTFGSQMTLADMGEKFPKNQISSECYLMKKKHIEKINDYVSNLTKNLGIMEEIGKIDIGDTMKLRQKIEKYKAYIIYDLAIKYYEQGKSIAIFVNFTNTLNLLADMFEKENIRFGTINGKQSQKERDETIDNFQKNKITVVLFMIQAGGVSISLHDVTGDYPRVSLISPSFSSIELLQTLGRVYRAGTLSPTLQRIIFCSGTYEEKICDVIKNKIKFISKISDEDLIFKFKK